MSPFSTPVLGSAALVTSPALWDAIVEQSLPLDQALVRYLVAVAICWVLIGMLAEFALKPPPRPEASEGNAGGETTVMDAVEGDPLPQ